MLRIEQSLDIVDGVCKKERVATILAAKGSIGYIALMMFVAKLARPQISK